MKTKSIICFFLSIVLFVGFQFEILTGMEENVSSQTTNLHLVKPAAAENVSRTVINNNYDIIDTQVKSAQDAAAAAQTTANSLSGQLANITGESTTINLDIGDLIEGKYINDSGKMPSVSGYKATDYISIPENTEINIKNVFLFNLGNVAFYDESQTFISSLDKSSYTGDLTNVANLNVTSPNNAAYIRWSCKSEYTPSGSYTYQSGGKFVEIEEKIKENSNSIDDIQEDIQDIQDTVNPYFTSGSNTFNMDIGTVQENKYINDQGKLANLSSYHSTDFVRVPQNKEITLKNVFLNASANIAFYDSNKTFISVWDKSSYSGDRGNASEIVCTTPNSTAYVRWSSGSSYTMSGSYVITGGAYSERSKTIVDGLEIDQSSMPFTLGNMGNKIIHPIVTLVDDDSHSVGIVNLKNMCDDLGIKCSFGVVYTKLASDENLLNTLKGFQEEGFHIMSHPDVDGSLFAESTYNEAACIMHITKSASYLMQNGFIDSNHIVSPGGASSAAVQKLYKNWSPSAIGSNNNTTNHLYGDGQYNIHRIFIEGGHDLQYYKDIIDVGIANNDWIILGTHSWKGINDASFMQMIRDVLLYVQSKSVPIETYNMAWKDRQYFYDLYNMY